MLASLLFPIFLRLASHLNTIPDRWQCVFYLFFFYQFASSYLLDYTAVPGLLVISFCLQQFAYTVYAVDHSFN